MFSTFETFQSFNGLLNLDAQANIRDIFRTLETFQLFSD